MASPAAPAPDLLELRREAQEPLLLAWRARARARIDRELDDAHAHAVKALTETLKTTPDGRPTLLRAARSRSFQAAVGHLDALLDALAGPSVTSLRGLVRDARESFYRASRASWLPFVPQELRHSPDPEPPASLLRDARRLVLFGADVRQSLGTAVARQRQALQAAVTRAGRAGAPARQAADLLRTWRSRAGEALGRATDAALSDGQARLDTLAGRDLVHPDHLDAAPVPGGPAG